MWHPPQLSRFILGPRPSGTFSTSAKSTAPAVKNAAWVVLNPASCPPAPAAPPRTPGSSALKVQLPPPHCDEAISIWKKNRHATAAANDSGTTSLRFIVVSSSTSNMDCAIVERTRRPAVEKIVLLFGMRFVLQNATSVPAAASLRMPRYFKDVARIPRLGLRKKCRGGTTEDSAGSTNGLIRRCLRCRRPATLKMTARRRRKSEGGSADGMEKKKALRLEGLSFWESGTDLLSRGIPRTIIGAAPFHGPVRDGKAWFQSALGTRHSLSPR